MDPETKKYKFIAIGSYWKYIYQSAVWRIIIAPRLALMGTTVFARSFPLSAFPTS